MFSLKELKKKSINAPETKKVDHVHSYHGREIADPYHWLKQKHDPIVRAQFEAENAYVEAVMAPTRSLQEELYHDMLSRIREDDLSVPTLHRGWWYYTRVEKGKSYKLRCRRRHHDGDTTATVIRAIERQSAGQPEEIMFDENKMAEGHSFFHLVYFGVNHSGQVAAYAYDASGAQKYTLGFRNLETGDTVFEDKKAQVNSFAWMPDDTYYFVAADKSDRARYLYHGTLAGEYELLYDEKDPLFYLSLQQSKDERHLFLSCESSDTSEMLLVAHNGESAGMRSLYGRTPRVQYGIDEREDILYLIEYGSTPHGRLLIASLDKVESPDTENSETLPLVWQELISESPEVVLLSTECFRDYTVLFERRDGVKAVSILDNQHERRDLPFERPIRNIHNLWNPDYNAPTFRISYSTLTTPEQVREYNADTGEYVVLQQKYAGEGFDSADYVEERLFAKATDGTRIPISLAYRQGSVGKGKQPHLHLYGYGSYGVSPGVGYMVDRLTLIDRGVVYAKAHIRGGGEYGRPWYEGGKMANKENTFTDFIACIEHLQRAGYGAPERTTIQGASAGGLLVGAVVNKRPELMRAALAGVPFVDMLNTMMDESLTSTTLEYE
ncbi:MAG: hypothetical protein COV10_00485, partial [Candidatus Vogelbacteria bacterium CG10_big_fil_rev_8_21_14_0_10_51_16]